MKTILAVIIACLIFAAPLLAEPPKAPEGTQSLPYLISQAQKIKLGSTKEAEVIALLGNLRLKKPRLKREDRKWGLWRSKLLKTPIALAPRM